MVGSVLRLVILIYNDLKNCKSILLFLYRKFLAGLVLGLHLTPARRLRPSLEKLKMLSRANPRLDPFGEATSQSPYKRRVV